MILSEVLTGLPPFAERRMSLEQVRYPERVPPSRWWKDLPRGLDHICLKCVAQEPHDRYASAGELAEDLRRFRAGEPLLAQPLLTRLVASAKALLFGGVRPE